MFVPSQTFFLKNHIYVLTCDAVKQVAVYGVGSMCLFHDEIIDVVFFSVWRLDKMTAFIFSRLLMLPYALSMHVFHFLQNQRIWAHGMLKVIELAFITVWFFYLMQCKEFLSLSPLWSLGQNRFSIPWKASKTPDQVLRETIRPYFWGWVQYGGNLHH